jgi:hypothetical protein
MPDSFLGNGNSSGIINGAPATDQFVYAGKVLHGLPSGMDASASLLSAHSSTVGQFSGGNGTPIKAESSFSSNQEFAFCNDSAFLEPCQSIGDVSCGSFSSSELNGQPLSDPIVDMDTSSYGFLSQIPRSLSFSDLTEDFIHSTGTFVRFNVCYFFSVSFLKYCYSITCNLFCLGSMQKY